ncbi:MAG: VCBS repeat-containing protein [Melioribacteraceae bacterium]|nr:VCBS repeat-containing protein [Melioribacteraceae bacterium]
MKHFDENIIELLIHGDKKILKRKEEIENHISECFSCRELYNQITQFYATVEKGENINDRDQKLIESKSLVINPVAVNKDSILSPIPKTIISRTYYFIRTEPVKATVSLAAAIAIFLMGLNFNSIFQNNNPAVSVLNDSLKTLRVYNNSSNELYSIPYYSPFIVSENEILYNINTHILSDLDNDKINELISIVQTSKKEPKNYNEVKIYNNKGEVINSATIGGEVEYFGRKLGSYFVAFSLVVADFDKDGFKEIYVGGHSYNSPYVLTKFDHQLNKIGEYWHHGHLWGMNYLQLGSEEGIVLLGLNDVNDDKAFPVAVFLDPNKIMGKLQSANTPVFKDLPLLNETHYKKFARTWISDSIKHKPRINTLLEVTNDSTFKVQYGFSSITYTNLYSSLILTLNKNFEVVDILQPDGFKRKWGKLDGQSF